MTNELQVELWKAGYRGDFSLESLIEACINRRKKKGYAIFQMTAVGQGELRYSAVLYEKLGEGSSAREAVARLYLALNNK